MVIVHEAELSFGVGAEVAARIAEKAIFELFAPVVRVGSHSFPYPFPGYEQYYHSKCSQDIKGYRQGFAGMMK